MTSPAPTGAFTSPTRLLTSVLAPAEKRTLLWLAHRMPRRVNSDHLTALAVLAMLGAGLSYWLASVTSLALAGVVACLGLNWFGDSLDGTLARVRGHERPRYGFYVDHVADVFSASFLLGGLALSGLMSPSVALGLLAAYLLLAAETFLATHVLGVFRITHFMIGPTELRILLAAGTVAAGLHPVTQLFGHEWRVFDIGGAIAIAGMAVTLVRSSFVNARALYQAEPLP